MMLLAPKKKRSSIPSLLISVEGTDKNRLKPVQENVEDAPVLSNCSFITNSLTKPPGVLEHCLEGETKCWFSIFLSVSSCSNSCKLYRRIPGTFWTYYVILTMRSNFLVKQNFLVVSCDGHALCLQPSGYRVSNKFFTLVSHRSLF